MDYFQLKSDKRFLYPPVITNLNEIVLRRLDMSLKNADNIPDISVGFASSEHKWDYIDVLDSQLFLVKDEIKKVFSIYEPAMVFKTVCVINNLDGSHCSYNAPLFELVDCLPDQYKQIQKRAKLKKLIIMEKEVPDYSIFKIEDIETEIIIVRLDVAESLLRRGIHRFTLERVELV